MNEYGGYWRHSMKTWFITGTSRGFGREWAIAALDRSSSVPRFRVDRVGEQRLVIRPVVSPKW
jgi:NAD(P)-dependent dehydrogenase (short-subunit alcohol dehydrogenase family)